MTIDSPLSGGPLSVEHIVSSNLIFSGTELSHQYRRRQPFPYVIIDEFFKPDLATRLATEINALPDEAYRVSFRSLAQRKLQLGDIGGAARHIHPVYEALMGPTFTRFVETVSGFAELEADRQFTGAGLHRYHRDGFSEIHLDSNRHPFDTGLHHRVNLLIFLNPTWRSEWGGELVLWSDRNGRPDKRLAIIRPTFNRGVFFSVGHTAWHSVNPIRCLPDRTRNSMAIYYFNRIGTDEDEKPRSVIWHSTHGWSRQTLFEVTNRVINLAKPHARYLRWLRPNKFDGVRPP